MELEQNKAVARRGGKIARNARIDLEKELGKSVISSKNSKETNLIK